MELLKNKVALITGAAQGIGFSIAQAFAEECADVMLADIQVEKVILAAEQIRAQTGRQAAGIALDVTNKREVEAAVQATLDTFGRIDILVNNAGVSGVRPVWGIPKASFERTLAVNLVGTFLCTKHVWPSMRERGGSIINISSQGGVRGYPLLSAYCASKWGQIGFTLACAEEGKAHGIRVNALAPGRADTAFRAQIEEDKTRMLKAEDHVGVCVFLASDESIYLTGQVIGLDWYGPEAGRS
jgi:3-hydroxybutyrate dehydrogenase